MKRQLERIELPEEHQARERAWAVVERAFAEREPEDVRTRTGYSRPAIAAVAALLALAATAVGLAGPSLVRSVREAVGVDGAEQALVGLPAAGRLLVDSSDGPWIVSADGSRRLLGHYAESAWSPHGLFEVVSNGRELAALDPHGNVRWSLERRSAIRDARWSPDGYRIAYRSGASLRVVAGDGTGDRLVAARVAPVAPAWRPGRASHVLAYVTPTGTVRVVDVDSGALVSTRPGTRRVSELLWSPEGRRLVVLRRPSVTAASWGPRGSRYAVVVYQRSHNRSVVEVHDDVSRIVFQGTGRIDGLAWSPDGRWLVLAWRTADQWVFAPASGSAPIRAIAAISSKFHSTSFPRLSGWCC